MTEWKLVRTICCVLVMGFALMSCGESDSTEKKTVFVTEGLHDGDLGGISGADGICQAEADAAGLFGIYRAWLSDATTSPAAWTGSRGEPYVLVTGALVATDWSDLTDGRIQAVIDITAGGAQQVEAGLVVWTGTNEHGEATSDNCRGWEGIGGMGTTGFIGVRDAKWSLGVPLACDEDKRLYCFQQ